MWDPYAEFEHATLPNGLTVFAAHWPDRPWQAVECMIHSGRHQEPAGFDGVAHFVEHMVSQNTTMPEEEIRAFFKSCGGRVYLGGTGVFFTRYAFFAPANATSLSEAFNIFGSMLLTATLTEQLELERAVIVNEFHQRKTPLSQEIAQRERRAVFPPSSREARALNLGTLEIIERLAADDLQRFYDTHYTPPNMSIVALGGMKPGEVLRLIQQSPLAVEKPGERAPREKPVSSAPAPAETLLEISLRKRYEEPPEWSQCLINALLPGTTSQYARYLFKKMLTEAILTELRTKRAWTYATPTMESAQFGRYNDCRIVFTCAPGKLDKAVELFDILIEELSGARGEALLERMREAEIAETRMYDATGRSVCKNAAMDLIHHGHIVTLEEEARGYATVTMDDIRAILAHLRPERRWTCLLRA